MTQEGPAGHLHQTNVLARRGFEWLSKQKERRDMSQPWQKSTKQTIMAFTQPSDAKR
jgi:hypothetical protein